MSDAPATTASRSSFYAGMRVLPKAQREAMFAIYGFCRAVDDIADDQQGDRATRAAALEQWRRDLDALYAGRDPGQAAMVAEAVRRFALDRADFDAVIDGMAMDVARDIRWPGMAGWTFIATASPRRSGGCRSACSGCRARRASSLRIISAARSRLTNILRDVDEDATIGRVYLPAEALADAGVALTTPAEVAADPRLDRAVRPLVALAHDHYRAADAILAARPPGHLLAPRLMEAVYSKLLRRMEARGWAPPRAPVKVSKPALLWTLARLLVTR